MLFNSIDFLLFFPVVTIAYFLLPHRVRWIWLLVASYYFYMSWNAKYALLIAASTVLTWAGGLLIHQADTLSDEKRRQGWKRFWLTLTLLSNLGILFFFKYFDFFLNNVSALLALAGITFRQPAVDIVLPVGISFYTFQALSYTIDLYREEIPPERNLFRYALFVSFFPQLVAGPIERSKNLLTQIHEEHTFDPDRARDGFLLMLWGMAEKIVIADRISTLITYVYDHYTALPGSAVILATALFAVQIYCDFAGYSNIAIGAAQVLGFRLMENFRQPYLSRSVAEFWRRWHISLSSWFRDYVYIPLGGNRKGTLRKYRNLLITFLVSGLWHGANWTFVVWGGLNGLYQVLGSLTLPVREGLCRDLHIHRDSKLWQGVQIVCTFCLVDFAWLFFRVDSLSAAAAMLHHTLTHLTPWGLGESLYTLGLSQPEFTAAMVAIAVLILVDVLRERFGELRPRLTALPLPVRWFLYLTGTLAVLLFGIYGPGYAESQFIYFQF